jgi:hypothetical protein
MSVDGPSAGRTWRYQLAEPDGTEIETGEFTGDEAAEAKAREVSKSRNDPVVVRRHSGHVDAWEYVVEVDERH